MEEVGDNQSVPVVNSQNQNKWLVIGLSLFIFACAFMITGYRLGSDLTRKLISQTATPAVTPVLTSTGSNKNTVYITTSNLCDNPIGLISYYNQDTGDSMKIMNTLLPNTPAMQSSFQSMMHFINNPQEHTDYMDMTNGDVVFKDQCKGQERYLFKEINKVTYSHTNTAKAILAVTKHDGYSLELRVYAIKEKYIVLLSQSNQWHRLSDPGRF